MAITVSVEQQTPLGSGMKLVRGSILGSGSYTTGGDYMNLASYLKSDGRVFVSFGGGSNVASAEFYTPSHDGGASSGGKVRMIAGSAGTNEIKALECNSSKNCALMNIPFVAIGAQF